MSFPVLEWRVTDEGLKPILISETGRETVVSWAAQEGSQQAFMDCPIVEVLYGGTRGPGKGLPLTTKIHTPEGFRALSELKVGDLLTMPSGGSAPIAGYFPQGVRPCYEITFRDGRTIVCDDQHRWKVKTGSGWKVWDTKTLFEHKECYSQSYFIPTSQPVNNAPVELPIDPYLLGLLLGDGTFRKRGSLAFCTVDAELADYAISQGFNEVAPDKRNNVRYFTLGKNETDALASVSLGLVGKTSHTKFIPEIYLSGSLTQRLDLLQGLMDTDGSSGKDSSCEFGSTSLALAQGVQTLCHSLGMIAKLVSKGNRHRVRIQHGNKAQLFRLARKAQKSYMHEQLSLRIESIVEVEAQETACIAVDHPEKLFIAGDYLVTHNTDALLMDFAQHCGDDDRSKEEKLAGIPRRRGFGQEWRGVLFRKTYPELEDVIAKSKKWFSLIWPKARFNEAKTFWEWPTGERLYFRAFRTPDDYWKYHGHAYPWIGWEELTTWPDPKCYVSMFSCSRSTVPGLPIKIRATTNPYGIGHNWVKDRFQLPIPYGQIIGRVINDAVDENNLPEPPRVAIIGYLAENRILLHAEGDKYVQKLIAAAPNAAAKKAWLFGDWDITAGGMIDDIWFRVKKYAVIPDFEVPSTWPITRSFDWGSSRPFAVGWWAESDGSDLLLKNGKTISTVKGDLFRIREWYGWNGQPNEGCGLVDHEIAKGIREREKQWGIMARVVTGVADSSIFDDENGQCIAEGMKKPVTLDDGTRVSGVRWQPADKSPGSRIQGWQELRKRLSNSWNNGMPREKAGLFIVGDYCQHFLRTVPTLPRDDKNMDDVDTDAEDHIGDEVRYRLRWKAATMRTGTTEGHY